jgi:F5/8 type C domain-containing protein
MKSCVSILLLMVSFGLFFFSCHSNQPDVIRLPKDVKSALEIAGPNQSELLGVIEHYNKSIKDSLKLKAAYFLIANMDGWYYYQGDLLDDYLDCIALLRKNVYQKQIILHLFDSLYGPFSYYKLDLKYDIRQVSAEELIGNIDMAFKVWREQPWGKDYSFDQFCEYILPFRMGDEIPEYQRDQIFDQYNGLLDSIRSKNGDAVAACTMINNELKKRGWVLTFAIDFLPHIPASKLFQYQIGSCREQADLGAYIMRSLGIPVSIDFIPHWPTRSLRHSFNAVIDNKGNSIMFATADDNPSIYNYAEMKKGKVYRATFKKNKLSLAFLKTKQELVPGLFESPYFKDVTNEYVSCMDIDVPLITLGHSINECKHAYICVFNNKEWVPIHWGNINKDSVVFTKMEGDIVYLPALYNSNGIIPANYPFILRKDGKLIFLIPNTRHLIPLLTIKRIFPVLADRCTKLDGGSFQGATTSDFKDPSNLLEVSKLDRQKPFWNGARIQVSDSFRYVRYYRSKKCSIGEIEFYSSKRKLSGRVISSKLSSTNDLFSKENAIDGDPATSFYCKNENSWVGLDFGRPEKIDSIRFSPGVGLNGPDYFIITNHKYELKYWMNSHWITISTCTAKNASVTFNNIPSNALCLVHDLTVDVEERIFTIDNGKQIWW